MDKELQYPCRDTECECSRCSHQIFILDNSYENCRGEIVYPGFCRYLSPPESFEIPADEFEEYLRNHSTKTTSSHPAEIQAVIENDDCVKPKRGRHKGSSIFDGQKVHQDIESDSHKDFLMINSRRFKLTRAIDWDIADQMLKAVNDMEGGFVIKLDSNDFNKLSPGGKNFVRFCLDRQKLQNPDRGHKYTGKARIKPNLLRTKQI